MSRAPFTDGKEQKDFSESVIGTDAMTTLLVVLIHNPQESSTVLKGGMMSRFYATDTVQCTHTVTNPLLCTDKIWRSLL
jgi:hypothetical protein